MHEKLKTLVKKLNEDSSRFLENDYRSQIDVLSDFATEFDRELKKAVVRLNGNPEFVDLHNSLKLCFQYEI